MVRFSELFTPSKDALVIYHMMFPRWSKDERAGASMGKTALLPLAEQPCPSCTSVVDGLNGPATHLTDKVDLVIVSKADPARLGTYAQERGWTNLRLMSCRNNTFNRDYHGETARRRTDPGPQCVLTRRGRNPPPVGERANVRARRQQPARSDLADLGRSRLDAKRTRRNSRLPLTTIRVAAVLRSQLRLRHNRPEPIMLYPSSFKHGNRHRPWTLRSEALPKAASRVTVLRNCIDWWVNCKSVLLGRSKVADGPE